LAIVKEFELKDIAKAKNEVAQQDPLLYGLLLIEKLESYSEFYWDNYEKNSYITEWTSRDFDARIRLLKIDVRKLLLLLENGSDISKEAVLFMMKEYYNNNFIPLEKWLKTLNIGYSTNNIINLNVVRALVINK